MIFAEHLKKLKKKTLQYLYSLIFKRILIKNHENSNQQMKQESNYLTLAT